MITIFFLFLLLTLTFEKSDVYFTKEISPEKIVELFKKLNANLKGKIGLKVHTGEKNGPYFLRPSFLKNIYDYTNGTFIETNVAYRGNRLTTELHRELLKLNGWNEYRTVIMDEEENNDKILNVNNYHKISKNIVGEHLYDFNSCLVLSHFKGHGMGGFGGALKQLSIGFASRAGKSNIHSAGTTKDYRTVWSQTASQLDFTSAMADAASSVVEYFKGKGGIAYINVLANISKSCDCAGVRAPEPKIRNIGILASTDPVAIDKACYDLIVKENTEGSKDFIKQVQSKLGLNTLDVSVEHGLGVQDYNLISIDNLTYIEQTKNESEKTLKHNKIDNNNNNNNNNNNKLIHDLIPIFSITILGIIIFVIYYIIKGKKNAELIKNETVGGTVPQGPE